MSLRLGKIPFALCGDGVFAKLAIIGLSVQVASGHPAWAQESSGQSEALPPVTVTAAAKKKAAKKKQSQPASVQTTPLAVAAPAAPSSGSPGGPPQDRNDPGTSGYVAGLSGVATKTPGSILDTPRSISTVTKAELEERGAQTVSEALWYTSGVNTYLYSGNFVTRDYTFLRGFLAYHFLDGLKQLDPGNYGIEPYGLERIDVLKGPASTLYGQGSPGGLVAMTSKRPTDEPFAEVVLQAGSHSKFQTGIDFGGPVGNNGVVKYRVTAMGRIADGEVDYTENDRFYVAPAVSVRLGPSTDLTVLSSYQRDPSLTVPQPLPLAGTIVPGPTGQYISRELFLGEPGYHDSHKTSYHIGYELKHRFNENWSFEQNAGYRNIDIALQEVSGRGIAAGATGTVRQLQDQDYEIETYQIDNRLHGRFSTGPLNHKVVGGFDYASMPNYQGTGVNRATTYALDLYNPVYGQLLAPNPITSLRDQDVQQTGVYLQDEISIAGLTVSGGIRHDWAAFDQSTRTVAGGVVGPAAVVASDDKEFTYNAGAIYNFSNGFAPYVSYSESFYPTVGSTFDGSPFKPTTGQQQELGFKYQPPGVNALFSAAVFDLVQQNVLTVDPVNRAPWRIQTGEVSTRGAEFEVRASLAEGWNVAAAYSYLDSEVTKVSNLEANRLGKPFVGVPTHQASLWSSYTFSEGILRGLTLGGGVRYFGATAGDQLATIEVPSFTLYDALVRYNLGTFSPELEEWELTFNAKNLTDERYVTNCEAATACYYGAGRTFDAALRMRF